jgi:hypothetical protein
MASITISGHKFEVPEGVLARYELGYQLQTEGEVAAIRQTLAENLRNNFASTVKAAGNGELTDEQIAELQAKFNEYAADVSVRRPQGRLRCAASPERPGRARDAEAREGRRVQGLLRQARREDRQGATRRALDQAARSQARRVREAGADHYP